MSCTYAIVYTELLYFVEEVMENHYEQILLFHRAEYQVYFLGIKAAGA